MDGTDGTVRLAGCPLNTRKILLDLSLVPSGEEPAQRVSTAAWSNGDIPLVPIVGLNHGTTMSHPSDDHIGLVMRALEVTSASTFRTWLLEAKAHAEDVFDKESTLAS